MKIRFAWAVTALLAGGCAGVPKTAAGGGIADATPAQAPPPGSFAVHVKAPTKEWTVRQNVRELPGGQPALFLLLHSDGKGKIFVYTFPSDQMTPLAMAESQRADLVRAGGHALRVTTDDPSGGTARFAFSGAMGQSRDDLEGMFYVRRVPGASPVSFIIFGLWDPNDSKRMAADLAAVVASLRVVGQP